MDYLNHTDFSGSDLETLLFRSDILAPHEYWKVHRPDRFRQPELELMLAVLEDALHCYFTNVQMRTRREKRFSPKRKNGFSPSKMKVSLRSRTSVHCSRSIPITSAVD